MLADGGREGAVGTTEPHRETQRADLCCNGNGSGGREDVTRLDVLKGEEGTFLRHSRKSECQLPRSQPWALDA